MQSQGAINRIVGAAFLVVAAFQGPGIAAQADPPTVITIPAPAFGQAAPVNVMNFRCHILPPQGVVPVRPDCDDLHTQATGPNAGPAATDLSDHGGPIITSTQHRFIFLNCPASCFSDWGNPFGFLTDLFASNYIHVTDQYMRGLTKANGRYQTSGSFAQVIGAQPHVLHDSDVHNLIMLAINQVFNPNGGGGGYNQMYSFFLPQGQDLCFNNSSQCYCPDNNCNGGTFAFCAYHGSFDAVDKNNVTIHVIYQAQPYDNVNGCNVTNGPNGALIDSTNNVFSHEIFETITDPDLNAWWRPSDGQEIGDICNFLEQNPITLNGDRYSIQKEYSNDVHTCAAGALRLVNLSHDFNFEGVSDVLWRDNNSGGVAMWLMSDNTVLSSLGVGNVPTSWQIVGQRDFNHDGFADILWRDTGGGVAMWLMNSGTVQSSLGVGNVPTNWVIAGTGDFNGDGFGDILWRDTNSGGVAMWLMNGATVSASLGVGSVPLNWVVAGTGDFDGDGMWDILWRDNNSGGVARWLMNGATVKSSLGLGSLPLNWAVVGTGDFDGNLVSDILWRDNNSGGIAMWLMNGGAVLASLGVGNVPLNWAIAITGDYNSDVKSDVLWRDNNSGGVAMWLMNGAMVQSSLGVGNIPTNWQIQGLNAD
jgi:hypothetical protein